jgi:chromosome segregation protein
MDGITRQRFGNEERAAILRRQAQEIEEKNNQARAAIKELEEEEKMLRENAALKSAGSGEIAASRDEVERRTAQLRAEERNLSDEKEKVSKELARLEERKAAAQSEYDAVIARLLEDYDLTRSEAEKITPKIEDPARAQKRLSEVKSAIKALGSVNVGAIEEFKEVSERYGFMKAQTDDVEESKKQLSDLIGGLTGKMREIFAKQFELINDQFLKTFVELFGGGAAHLELTQPDDVLTSGIEIIVQPPGKIIKNLSMLSGGERAFVAIALYFAILKVRPSPFCVLDEIEAALDDSNVARFAAYLRRMCDDTQFIVITHRRGTMDEADVLYGVTMQDEGVSKLLTLDVDELVERLGIKA